jgi:hypothetical protein
MFNPYRKTQTFHVRSLDIRILNAPSWHKRKCTVSYIYYESLHISLEINRKRSRSISLTFQHMIYSVMAAYL